MDSRSVEELSCALHSEKLDFFCLEDKQPACLMCRDSQKHDNHTFRPISEVVPSYKKELSSALKSSRMKLKHSEDIKEKCVETVQHIKSQAERTERQIKQEFKKLHRFLRDEEEATINFLMINCLCVLQKFPVPMERDQSSEPDPQMASGSLIHVPHHLGNLPFRVWKKMQDIVQNTPVILDPNTAHPDLILSDDLTRVKQGGNKQLLPDNPERFDLFPCVLGSEGFNSGTHCWDVEVKKSSRWRLGITTASNQRKGGDFFNTDVWSKLDRVRVDLDYDRGMVSFSDPVSNTYLHSITTTFNDTVYPFFYSFFPLRILSSDSQ
ncbi:hypothetical protein PO909_000988 [Leuciscus waleckii]